MLAPLVVAAAWASLFKSVFVAHVALGFAVWMVKVVAQAVEEVDPPATPEEEQPLPLATGRS
jgi:hypothetical protein